MVQSISLEEYDFTLQKIYGAATDPGQWRDAFYAIEDLTGSAGATLNFVPLSSDRQGLVLSGRFTEDICTEYARDYMGICRRIDYAVRNGDGVIYDSMVLNEKEMDRDPVYDWFGKQGLRYFIGTNLPPVDGYQLNFSLQRTRRQGHAQTDDISLFQQLSAHVKQAVILSTKLGALDTRSSLNGAALDRLPQGVIITGERGNILFMNTAADRILACGKGLRARNNVVEAITPNDQRRFAGLLQGAAAIARGGVNGRDFGQQGGWLSLERDEGQYTLSLFIAPLTVQAGISGLTSPWSMHPAAIIILHDRDGHAGMAVAMLRGLFGLTSVEAQLAALLGQGLPLDQAAARLGHAVGTARNHLKSIFGKMGVSRQQDLVHIVTGLTAQGLTGELTRKTEETGI
jgi:DNA-binding CsgD family transcriptional regulator/PAS domain-containing protein